MRAADNLSQVFANPPAAAHPHTWWHWNNGNVNKEGITLDLEAMKRIGVTGAQIFNVKQGGPDGPVADRQPGMARTDQVRVQEADRLGMELTIHNCPGWSESGGPWITPEQSMQKVVWTETHVKGGEHFSGTPVAAGDGAGPLPRHRRLLPSPSAADERRSLATAKTITVDGADGALVPIAPDASPRQR